MTPLWINSEDIHISIYTVYTVCIRLYSIYTVYIRYNTVYGNVIYGSGQPYLSEISCNLGPCTLSSRLSGELMVTPLRGFFPHPNTHTHTHTPTHPHAHTHAHTHTHTTHKHTRTHTTTHTHTSAHTQPHLHARTRTPVFLKRFRKPWNSYHPEIWEIEQLGPHIVVILLPQPAGIWWMVYVSEL